MENQLPQITYLFGAGASAQKLPTIKGLPERIRIVRDFVEANYLYEDNDTYSPKEGQVLNRNEAKQFLLQGLENLQKVSFEHSTIDTFVKKLYLNHRSFELNEISFFLALYFTIEQKIVGVDPRYETFLISILESSIHQLPENLKFLSWNYDLQMEIAYQKISGYRQSSIAGNRMFNTNVEKVNDRDKFLSVKLNGSCDVVDSFRSDFYSLADNTLTEVCKESDLNMAMAIGYLQIFKRQRIYDCHINIKFAWEHGGQYLDKIAELYSKTEILIVIGYSFPFFNREIDRKIIRAMTNLKKIYLQDVFPDNIKSRFLSILPDWQQKSIQIISVTNIDEFFLPPEL